MSLKLLICVIGVFVQAVYCKPQLITFKDGKIGVNFGGYHAEAGLGGLLTGNAAHGGLSASAGTPFGQQAGAGLGGSLDGRAGGGGYAGASAGYGVGASAAFGGGLNSETGGGGGVGAEAHIPGKSTKVIKLSQIPTQESTGGTVSNKVVKVAQLPIEDSAGGINTVVKTNTANVLSSRGSFEDAGQVQGNNKVFIQKEVYVPRREYAAAAPVNFDYRNFLDFGFFSNTAAGFGGPQAYSTGHEQTGKTVNTIKRYKRQALSSDQPKPILTFERNISFPVAIPSFFPQFHARKYYSWPRFSLRNLFFPFHYQKSAYVSSYRAPTVTYPTFYYRKWFIPNPTTNVTVGERIDAPSTAVPEAQSTTYTTTTTTTTSTTESNFDLGSTENSGEVNVEKRIDTQAQVQTASQPASNGYGYTKTVSYGHQPGFFDAVFNIPIATLTAVNQLTNNIAANGGVKIQKSVEIGNYRQ